MGCGISEPLVNQGLTSSSGLTMCRAGQQQYYRYPRARRNLSLPVPIQVDIRPQSTQVDNVMQGRQMINIIEHSAKVKNKRSEAIDLIQDNDGLDCNIQDKNDSKIEKVLRELQNGELFCDKDFTACHDSLYFTPTPVDKSIEWKRPWELFYEPQLVLDGPNKNDIVQGILGDCWLLSSCAAVAQRPDLMDRIIPPGQVLYGEEYQGVIRFRFWRFGRWITVYIDDLLPTKHNHLIYARCMDPNEFWVALLEKAYAKLHGSYEALEGGQAMDALVDLTSGLAERYDLLNHSLTRDLHTHLQIASAHGAFITCSRKGDWRRAFIADQNGLVSGHAYTVTGVATVPVEPNVSVKLVRIRNPWGNATEWNGDWSDNSPYWALLDDKVKRSLGYEVRGDGEFWMSWKDFCVEFEEVSICTLGPDFDSDGVPDKAGQIKLIHGYWELNRSCGGSRNDFFRFATNPQYLLTLKHPRNRNRNAFCSVVIALMQGQRHSSLRHRGLKMLQIGFVLYKTPLPQGRLPAEHFMYQYDVGGSGTYINYREVFGRFELRPGHYVIVPATFEPECPASFMIRVYADTRFDLKYLK